MAAKAVVKVEVEWVEARAEILATAAATAVGLEAAMAVAATVVAMAVERAGSMWA